MSHDRGFASDPTRADRCMTLLQTLDLQIVQTDSVCKHATRYCADIRTGCSEKHWLIESCGFTPSQLSSSAIGYLVFLIINCLITWLFFAEYAVVVPFEYYHKPFWLLTTLSVFGLYLFVNLWYHYYKSCFTSPGFAPKVTGNPLCWQCGHYKPLNAHHCSVCNRCVLRMDHHCIFIGQCVGLHNHRHFLQFVFFLGLSGLTAVLSGLNTFWYNVILFAINQHQGGFCKVVSDEYFLKEVLCLDQKGFIVMYLVFTSYAICSAGTIIGFMFFIWNGVLISANMTHVEKGRLVVGYFRFDEGLLQCEAELAEVPWVERSQALFLPAYSIALRSLAEWTEAYGGSLD
uniref:Palmitoyltransferase n=1 Tax=Steinernema glaseri TaxID=37863 RepID=A0A1I7Y8W0_9BILA